MIYKDRNMKKIYILVRFDGFEEGYKVIGAFSSEDKAEKIKEGREDLKDNYIDYDIWRAEIDGDIEFHSSSIG